MTVLARRPYCEGGRRHYIKGQTYGYLTAIAHVGFLGNMSAWSFRCVCGRTVIRRASLVIYAAKQSNQARLHCGCKTEYRRHGLSRTPPYIYWSNTKRLLELPPEWHLDVRLFEKECYSQKNGYKYLVRRDLSRPISRDNFQWANHTEAWLRTVELCVSLLVGHELVGRVSAEARVANLSRQRINQIIWRYTGRCIQCSKPRDGTSVAYCRACRQKDREQKKAYWKRRAIARQP